MVKMEEETPFTNKEEKEEIFVDWGKKETYVLERGEGECMA